MISQEASELRRYAEYQRFRRQDRIETLGGAATAIVLSTIDLGLTESHDPRRDGEYSQGGNEIDTASLRTVRQRRVGSFALERAELGYAAHTA